MLLRRLLELFRRYLTLLARVQIGQRLQGKVDAADLVQETFLERTAISRPFEGRAKPNWSPGYGKSWRATWRICCAATLYQGAMCVSNARSGMPLTTLQCFSIKV